MQNPLKKAGTFWRNFRWKTPVLAALVILIIIVVVLGLSKDEDMQPEVGEQLPTVETKSLSDIQKEVSVTQPATLKAENRAQLIARTGGRVTAVKAPLGSEVKAGQVVVEIDGGTVANPTRAQVEGASRSLAAFNAIERETLTSSDLAVSIAQQNLDAAGAGRSITGELQTLSVNSARVAVDQAQASYNRTALTPDQNELLVDAAELGVDAAKLARDQAALSAQLTRRQTNDALQTARLGFEQAQTGKQQTQAQLSSQRIQLETQLRVAQETLRLAQGSSPITGQVVSLTATIGQYVQPGQVIGEVINPTAGTVTINVTSGVRNALSIGQDITLTANGQTMTGTIARAANVASSNTSLWQIDINIANVPQSIGYNTPVVANLPALTTQAGNTFLPLDALNVRQQGIIVLALTDEGTVKEYPVSVLSYHDNYVETDIKLPPSTEIVISGNRTLRDGDSVAQR